MWQQATHTTYHHLLAAQQETYKEVGVGGWKVEGGGDITFKQNSDDK